MIRTAKERLLEATRPLVFGMVHVPALPGCHNFGTPFNKLTVPQISTKVRKETRVYADAGVDGIILENMHDLPYVPANRIGPEVTATMTRFCMDTIAELGTQRSKFLLGIQILAQGNVQALAVAHAVGFDFIRAECFVFSQVADEGFMNACAGELLRYRKAIGADSVAVFTDLKKKHAWVANFAHAITADVSIAGTAKAAEFFQADGLIVTGQSTGDEANPSDLQQVKAATKLPVLVGSGITQDNWTRFSQANGFIIGSFFKKDGDWAQEIVPEKVQNFVNSVKATIKSSTSRYMSTDQEQYLEY